MIDFVETAFRVPILRVCRAVPALRPIYHYRSVRPSLDVVRRRNRELAETHVRYGRRRIHILLRRQGWPINVKRVRRRDNLEGLQMRLWVLTVIDAWIRGSPVMRMCRSATAM